MTQPVPDPAILRVMTLNIWGLPYFSRDRAWRVQNISAAISRDTYDIIGLQELWLPKDLRPVLQGAHAAGMPYHHHYYSDRIGSGLVLLSRYPIISVDFRRFRLSGSAETLYHGDYIAGKGIGFAQIKTPTSVIDVYLLHAIAQYHADIEDIYRPHRLSQLYEAARFINAHSNGHPVIIIGDFNTRPDQFGYQAFSTLTATTDCYAALNPGASCVTHDPDNPYLSSQSPSRCLDYVFVRRGESISLVPKSAKIIFKSLTDLSRNRSGAGYSDHYGVGVDLALEYTEADSVPHVSNSDRLAVTEMLAQLLTVGLSDTKSRRRKHTQKLIQGVGAVLPTYLARKQFPGWLTAMMLPVVVVYVLIRAVLALWTVPKEIGDMQAITREIAVQRATLAHTDRTQPTV